MIYRIRLSSLPIAAFMLAFSFVTAPSSNADEEFAADTQTQACICSCKIECQRQSPPYSSYDALIKGYWSMPSSGGCAALNGEACLATCPPAGGGGVKEGTLQGCKAAPKPLPVPGAMTYDELQEELQDIYLQLM